MAGFFSLEGQLQRLTNVKDVLLSAVGINEGGVKANTGFAPVDAVLGAAASHPFLTAGLGAVAVNPAGAAAVVKSGAKAIGSEFSKATLGQKAVAVVSAPIVAGAVVSSPKIREAALNAPSSLANFGGNVGALVEDPNLQNLKKLASENPLITAGAAAAGLGVLGAGVAGALSTLSTRQNTQALLENSKIANIYTEEAKQLLTTKTESVAVPVLSSPLAAQPLTTVYPEKRSIMAGTRKKQKKALPAPIFRNIFKPVMIQVNRNG